MGLKLVVNTNRIVAALIKDSMSRKLLYYLDADFLGVKFSEKELKKYKETIMKKANITEEEFGMVLKKITYKIVFLEDELLKPFMDKAKETMNKIDADDTPFIAAALATGADIWSDDLHFEKQKIIKVWKTIDLVNFL